MLCHDCLIWVGQSYRTVAAFVKEAQRRGCCRQVPGWPSWIMPGKTRVFLAHHDGRGKASEGVIFGYFVVGGVDIVMRPSDCAEYKKIWASVNSLTDGGPVPLGHPFWNSEEGMKCAQQMLDFWRKRGVKLPFRLPPSGKVPKSPSSGARHAANQLWNFLVDLLVSCEPNYRSPHGGGLGISTDFTAFEETRLCGEDGLRIGPVRHHSSHRKSRNNGRPAVYLVDALTRAVDEAFCKLLKEVLKQKKTRSSGTKSGKRSRQNRPPGSLDFQKAIKSARHDLGLPADSRKGKLTLFAQPFPAFKRFPQASFRGVLRVAGDELLQRIEESGHVRVPLVVPVCCGATPPEKKARRQLELLAAAAGDLGCTEAYAHQFVAALAKAVNNLLQKDRTVFLPGIGRLNTTADGNLHDIRFRPDDSLQGKLKLTRKHPSPRSTAHEKETVDFETEMAANGGPQDRVLVHRGMDWLSRWIEQELSAGRPVRLTHFGTFTPVKRKHGERKIQFRPSDKLQISAMPEALAA